MNPGVGRDKSYKNAMVCEVSRGGPTAVEQLEEMLDQRHQEKEEPDYLVMDLIISFGKRKRGRENISGFWPSPSLTESQASKVVAHGRMQFFRGERFDRRIGLFMKRSYQGRLKDKVTIIG